VCGHAGLWRPGERVLSVTDGEGRNRVWLASQGLVVHAFDIAAVGVAKARRLAAAQGVRVNFTVSDCDSYPRPESACDGVAAIFVQFADPPRRERLFARIERRLKPGSALVLQGYTPKQLDNRTGGPPIASHLHTAALLRSAFTELEIVEPAECDAVLDEGSGHCGRSALIGLVVRRR
jgi:SAM-dependent methyltransferase